MTPEQQRTQTLMANFQRENLHKKCQKEIKISGPHLGLYCSNPKCKKTGQWLTWTKKTRTTQIF
jgi:hypothetical protein